MDEPAQARAAANRLAAALPDQSLDVALAEILASIVVTAFDPIDPLVDALIRTPCAESVGLLAAIAAIADPHSATAAGGGIELLTSTGVSTPTWSAVAGTALPDEARLADYRHGAALAVRWRHGDGSSHIMFNVMEDEQITEIRFLEGDLFDVIEQSPSLTHFTLTDVALPAATEFLDGALARPIQGDDRTWHNAPLARVRFATLGVTRQARFVVPGPRDPDDYSLAAMGIDLLKDNRHTPWSGPLW